MICMSPFKENNWQYLWSIKMLELLNRNWNLGELVFATLSLTVFQHVKTFVMKLVVILVRWLLTVGDEICMYLEDPRDSVNPSFLN